MQSSGGSDQPGGQQEGDQSVAPNVGETGGSLSILYMNELYTNFVINLVFLLLCVYICFPSNHGFFKWVTDQIWPWSLSPPSEISI